MRYSLSLTLLYIFILSSDCFAQLERDPKAKEILKGVSDKYKSFKSVSSDFKIIIDDPKTNSKETQKGTIFIKGDKYKLTLSDQEVISDGKTIWTFLKESNEVQINEATAKAGSITPNTIFTIYETGFGSRFMGEKKTGTKTLQIIDLVPEDTKKPYFKIQLLINKGDKQLVNAKIFQKNGSFLLYSIETFKPNIINDDGIFSFQKEKHPGVEIIDLR